MSGRTILRLGGADVRKFLQNLVSNDVARLQDGAITYATLLTPQGKYLADFFVVASGDDLLIDVAADLAPGLMQRLVLYRLRAAVTIAESDLAVSRGTGPRPDGALADPRHPALGWRLYGSEAADDGTDWDALRVEHLIAEYPNELVPNDSFILEWQLDRLHGIDFRKGCYVGQEVTARMKHKTELRKGIARVAGAGLIPGTEIALADGRVVGRVGTVTGARALAWLRYDMADQPLNVGGEAVTVDWMPD